MNTWQMPNKYGHLRSFTDSFSRNRTLFVSNFSSMQARFRNPDEVEALIKEQLVAAGERTTQTDMARLVGMADPKLLMQRLRGSLGELSWFEERLAKLGIHFRQFKDWIVTEKDSDWLEYSSDSEKVEEQPAEKVSPSDNSASMPSASLNIPGMLHGCLGRDKELAAIREEWQQSAPRPILLYGGPGIGKTTLKKKALVVEDAVLKFGARRYWVEADQAYNAETLARLIADSVGLGTLDPNPQIARTTLLEHLRKIAAPVAIGLDNIETPLGMAVQPEGAPEPDPKTEVETRELLKALGEIPHVALLASFRGGTRAAAGTFWHGVEVKPLAEDPAVVLFLEVASSLEPQPTEAKVADLVRQVDNVPLAVVLLASYAETAGSFTQLEREWKDRSVALMEHGPGRDDSWKEALRFSLESPILQTNLLGSRLVRLMGQLPDGIRQESAEEAMAADESAVTNARTLLFRLGLIQNRSDGETVRWTMLHPIREFLRTVDSYAPDQEDWNRSAEKYLRLLDIHGPKLGKEREAIEALYPEIDNVGAALLKQLRENRNNPQLLSRFWYYGAFIYWVIEKGNLQVLDAGAQQNSKSSRWFPGKLEVRCIFLLASIHLKKSELDLAQSHFREALTLYRKIGEKVGEVDCIWRLGDIHLMKSELDLAQAYYREALTHFRKIDNEIGEANCIWRLGDVHLKKSELDLAKIRYVKALTLFRKTATRIGEADCIFRLGDIHLMKSELDLAQPQFREALALYCTIGEKLGEADCIRRLGDIHLMKSELDLAHDYYREAFTLFIAISNKVGEANCTKGFGDVAARRGDITEAKEHFEEALKLFETIGFRENQAMVLLCLSYLPESPEVQEGYRERARIILDKVFTSEQYARFEATNERLYRSSAVD